MRKLFVAGIFLMIVASDWAWTKNSMPKKESFVPKSFSAKFVQQYISKLSKKVKKSDGMVDYKYPSNIRFEMKGKSDLIYVSNPKKTWIYRPSSIKGEPAQLNIGKSSDDNLVHFFDILENGLKDNEEYKVARKDDSYEITFSDKTSEKIDLKKATLYFKPKSKKFKDITKIDLIRKKNKKVSMIFSKIEVDKTFSSKHFHFVPPSKNVRISN